MMENRCPDCGSAKVEGISRKRGFIGWCFFPFSNLVIKPRKRCKQCKAIWRTG